VSPETVRHLISFYGGRAEEVLKLAKEDPSLRQQISPNSPDIYAQIALSVREEGGKTISDIVLRRMHLGITAGRGMAQAEKSPKSRAGTWAGARMKHCTVSRSSGGPRQRSC